MWLFIVNQFLLSLPEGLNEGLKKWQCRKKWDKDFQTAMGTYKRIDTVWNIVRKHVAIKVAKTKT